MTTPRIHTLSLAIAICLLSPLGGARAADAPVNPPPHFESGRSSCVLRRRRAVPDARWPMQQFKRVAAFIARVWAAFDRLGANTLEAPVYWEQFEADPGHFDTTIVDTMIRQAREHRRAACAPVVWHMEEWELPLRAVLDEGQPRDLPEDRRQEWASAWIHPRRIQRRRSRPTAGPLPSSCATSKSSDGAHTVIMIQVENESGAWNSIRDYSVEAQALFEKPVPRVLLDSLGLKAKAGGNWTSVFGKDSDEYFHAWSVASFVGQVAAAGKAEYRTTDVHERRSKGPYRPWASGHVRERRPDGQRPCDMEGGGAGPGRA